MKIYRMYRYSIENKLSFKALISKSQYLKIKFKKKNNLINYIRSIIVRQLKPTKDWQFIFFKQTALSNLRNGGRNYSGRNYQHERESWRLGQWEEAGCLVVFQPSSIAYSPLLGFWNSAMSLGFGDDQSDGGVLG